MTDTFDLAGSLQKYKAKTLDLKYPRLALLYSKPGSGKSHTALTASELPGVKKMLYLDTEGSTVGVANNFDLDKIDIIPVATPTVKAIGNSKLLYGSHLHALTRIS